VERYGIGYAPDAWRTLREEAHKHGIEDDVLLAAGLIKESDRGEEPYDRFRDRLIFPIAELSGRVIAFGGRILSKSENAPKYLNSPETVIYHKGELLYGLNWAKGSIRREGMALVVEGYMDYVSLAGRGIENVVAGMGTAMTEAQANLLARYSGKALLLYDSDAAGLKATFRTADALLHAGVHPLVVTLPTGEDPDSVVRAGGAAALRPYLHDALDVMERKIQMLEERGFFEDIEGVRRALDRLLPTLRSVVDPALRDIYTARVAQKTGVRRETLEHELERSMPPEEPPQRRAARADRPMKPAPMRAEHAAERIILKVLISDPTRAQETNASMPIESFRDPRHQEIFRALLEQENADELRLSTAAASVYQELTTNTAAEITDADRMLYDSIASVRLEDLKLQQGHLQHEIEATADAGRQHELTMDLYELQRQLGRLTGPIAMGSKGFGRYRKSRVRRPSPPPTAE
jgi:DNA primase